MNPISFGHTLGQLRRSPLKPYEQRVLACNHAARPSTPAVVLGIPMDVLVLRVDWGTYCTDLGLEWAPGSEDWDRIAPPF